MRCPPEANRLERGPGALEMEPVGLEKERVARDGGPAGPPRLRNAPECQQGAGQSGSGVR